MTITNLAGKPALHVTKSLHPSSGRGGGEWQREGERQGGGKPSRYSLPPSLEMLNQTKPSHFHILNFPEKKLLISRLY